MKKDVCVGADDRGWVRITQRDQAATKALKSLKAARANCRLGNVLLGAQEFVAKGGDAKAKLSVFGFSEPGQFNFTKMKAA